MRHALPRCRCRPDVVEAQRSPRPQAWQDCTRYEGGLTAASPQVACFWRALALMSTGERRQVLRFAAGLERLPNGAAGFRFTITPALPVPP